MKPTLSLCLLVLASSCASHATSASVREPGSNAPSASTAANASEPALYARDGSVVSGGGSTTAMTATPTHDVQPRDGSRVYLLDLYQKALDEKEALALEVKNLTATLEQQLAQRKSLEKERDQALAKNTELENEGARLATENADLAARLTTAQIRRLEAEKLLLEAKIDAERTRAEAATKKPSARSSPNASAKSSKSASEHKP